MSSDTLDIADDSRGPKHYGQLIRTMPDGDLTRHIYNEQSEARGKFNYDSHAPYLSPSLKQQLEEMANMITDMARVMVMEATGDEEDVDEAHALAWFNCFSYRNLWREAKKRGLEL